MFTLEFDYAPSSRNEPRYTPKFPASFIEKALAENAAAYRDRLRGFAKYFDKLSRIPADPPEEGDSPFFDNPFLPGLDCVALYCLVSENNGRSYVEVGSGNSTKFVRRSISDNALQTKIVSIDPHPRAEIDHLSDEIIRQPLEETDLTVFGQLEAGDTVFLDSSHRCFMNSDVTVCFLEILPRLRKGVMVQIHDIFWPSDYPGEWNTRYYNEQYLLGALLANGLTNYEIVLPCYYVATQPELTALIDPLWDSSGKFQNVKRHGGSFWMRKL